MREWIGQGKLIVCNRYIGSNIGHMAATFKSQNEKLKYIKWLEDLEYRENKIPKEDLVVLLQVDPKVSRKLMEDRKLDIHEKDLAYQKEVYSVYDYVAGIKKNWARIDCARGGKLLSADEIHKKVVEVLRKSGILK